MALEISASVCDTSTAFTRVCMHKHRQKHTNVQRDKNTHKHAHKHVHGQTHVHKHTISQTCGGDKSYLALYVDRELDAVGGLLSVGEGEVQHHLTRAVDHVQVQTHFRRHVQHAPL